MQVKGCERLVTDVVKSKNKKYVPRLVARTRVLIDEVFREKGLTAKICVSTSTTFD